MATEFKLNYTAAQVNDKLSQIENKVDKIEGKGLSTNDFTTEEKEKLESLNNSNIMNGTGEESVKTIGAKEASAWRALAEGSNTIARGGSSHAEGTGSIASGNASHAEGSNSRALGARSHSEGRFTFSKGNDSHAEGGVSIAYGVGAHAEGSHQTSKIYLLTGEANATTLTYSMKSDWDQPEINDIIVDQLAGEQIAEVINVDSANSLLYLDAPISSVAISNKEFYACIGALGARSHAEGSNTQAIGANSHAEGSNTVAFGHRSHAENASRALGDDSHAEGTATIAYGTGAHAEGENTNYIGLIISGAAGTTTYTTTTMYNVQLYTVINCQGKYARIISVDEANNSFTVDNSLNPDYALSNVKVPFWKGAAIGNYSHIEGKHTIAMADYQHVEGKFNVIEETSNYAHIVGNGGDEYTRSNAYALDWQGNANYAGDVYVQGNGYNNFDGKKKLATEEYVDSKAGGIKVTEIAVPSTDLSSGTSYTLGIKTLHPSDVIEVKPDYTKITGTVEDHAKYREAIRNANFGVVITNIYEYNETRAEYSITICPDGEIDTSIPYYYFYVINWGSGGAW